MKSRDIVIGFIFLVILIAGVLWIFRNKNLKISNLPVSTPNIVSKIDNTFPNLNIPAGTERANLSDVGGGNAVGVATRTEIVANLPSLTSGQIYQGWLENSLGKTVLIGDLRVSKSGWILGYDSTKYPAYNKVIVTQGSSHILEGSF